MCMFTCRDVYRDVRVHVSVFICLGVWVDVQMCVSTYARVNACAHE